MFTNIQKPIGIISLWFIVSLVLVFFPYQWVIGVIPRNIVGIPGIWGSPFFHDGLGHLMSNAIPMYILGCLVSVEMSRQGFIWTNFLLITASGSLLWVFGRSTEHIGASGLVFAYLGYLVSSWWHSPKNWIALITIGGSVYVYFWVMEDIIAIIVASIATVYMVMTNGLRIVIMTYITGAVVYLYWYLIPTIFTDAVSGGDISWDGHLCGLIAGCIIGKYQYKERNSQ